MLTNDQVVLLDYLTQRRETEAPGTSESEYFELFTAGEISTKTTICRGMRLRPALLVEARTVGLTRSFCSLMEL